MSDVPPEIIREILIRLPVKSLLRFRCVSKPWRSMIDSKYFAKLHLSHSYATNSNSTLVVNSTKLFYIDLHSFEQLDIGDIITLFEPITTPRSCDGLVLIVINLKHILIWNPATRKFNKLPAAQWEFKICDEAKYFKEQYGIGYDSKHDDYKVVGVIQTSMMQDGERLASETKIYSLKSNTWKRIEDFPYMLHCGKRWGAYLNDALHGVVKDKERSDVIMAFNIANEEHYEVPKPGVNHSLASVEVMGGCLTAIVPGKSNISEIWVMKEYGVKDSWTKLFRVKSPDPSLNLFPLAYSKSRDKVLLNCDGMFLNWYDLRKKTALVARVPGLTASFNSTDDDPPFYAEFCVGSLVSPHSPVGTRDEV